MLNRFFDQYPHFYDFEILESRILSGYCGFEFAQDLILNNIHGPAKPFLSGQR
ncbi:MAG TPA: hypothetical protein VKA34_11455 [Balneolales bacterium]|nr:hypothetical protein [Balneolales bacterium]